MSENPSIQDDDKQDMDELKRMIAIRQLLDICAANEIDVPLSLKRALIGDEAGQVCEEYVATSQTELLTSLVDQVESEFLLQQEKGGEDGKEEEESKLVQRMKNFTSASQGQLPDFELRVQDGSFTVTNVVEDADEALFRSSHHSSNDSDGRAKQKIKTVQNSSPLYQICMLLKKCIVQKGNVAARKEQAIVMEKVNLVIENGKTYLVLGAPGSGKSTLLKMLSNNLYKGPTTEIGGTVSLNGVQAGKQVVWSNLIGYVDQIDRLHPYLTVQETCEFAWKCRSGGTHRRSWFGTGDAVDQMIAQMDDQKMMVKGIMEGLGLTRVQDTFVGDTAGTVRGVSGGERKRVTVAEMLCTGVPILCGDEISTGLDAATTYDITKLFRAACRIQNKAMIISLLQPPPETVANFHELILLAQGKVIYSGPVFEVIQHFNSLGYDIPERMDVADWLQQLPTRDGWQYLQEAKDPKSSKANLMSKHLTAQQFMEKFYESERGRSILERVQAPLNTKNAEFVQEQASQRYANSNWKSLKLVVGREVLLWWRDKYAIRAKLGQSIMVGIIAGTLFWQVGQPLSMVSVLFQSMFICIVGAMLTVVKQFPQRSIFYKHQDANFFPTWTYVIGRSVANIPASLFDSLLYGSIVFWFVGFSYNDGASIVNYFMYMLLLLGTSVMTSMMFGTFPAYLAEVTLAQAAMAVTIVILMLFCGFTVQPDVIPNYYIWIYWLNPLAWILRGLVVNEFDSGAWDNPISGQDVTEGQATLIRFGFTLNDDPFTFKWAGYAMAAAAVVVLFSAFLSNYGLTHIRFATGKPLITDPGKDDLEDVPEPKAVSIPFKKVDLTFKGICYTVKSSIADEKLQLLKDVSGIVEAGKMTALMGSSGAGKTTLMDVLAMRKTSGEIEGEIRLNGHLQEEKTFRRCMGYVEQFDTQSAQLTIRETVQFSAKLRLEETDPAVNDESIKKFIDQTLHMLELTNIQDLQVGSDAEGGLSFEQRKRLSIAVELVANPSILFLDEPTSGLDARAASIVMRGLRRIALSGRAICATIHQPSVSIFNDFDRLLLLKRGGETIFFGDIGENSSLLIEYLERYDVTPKIMPGVNPATWMLTVIGAGSAHSSGRSFDYAGSYAESKLHKNTLEKIHNIVAQATEENKVTFPSTYATSRSTQRWAVLRRTMTIYFRSPNYNTTRILVSVVVALLFSSVYATQRVPENEGDMNSRMNSIFISTLFLCVNAQNSVLAVFEAERNMFYRHKAANMYDTRAILMGFTFAEIPFILLTGVAYCVPFYFIMGFAMDAGKFFFFYMFFVFALSCFTFLGQMLVSLFRDAETAQGLGGLVISMTVLTSGILLRPSDIPQFWIFAYWIFPGHYFYEGIFMSQFEGDTTPIEATVGSPFFQLLKCRPDTPCVGTAAEWVQVNFSSFSADHRGYDAGYLLALLAASRVVTYLALTNLNYRAT